jgi:hypothetical protein
MLFETGADRVQIVVHPTLVGISFFEEPAFHRGGEADFSEVAAQG